MFNTLRGRVITILVLVGISAWQLYSHGIKYGLDLQGGMHLVLEVSDPDGTMTAEARADAIDQAHVVILSRVDQFGVQEPLVQKVGSERIVVELAGISDPERARAIISQAAFLQFKLVRPTGEVQAALPRMDRAIVAAVGADSLRKLGREMEGPATTSQSLEQALFGARDTAAPADTIQAGDTAQAGDSAAVDSAAVDSAAAAPTQPGALELRPLTALLNTGDVPGSFFVAAEDVETLEGFLDIPEVQRLIPRDLSLQWSQDVVAQGARSYRRLYVLQAEAFMDGTALTNASAQRDPQFNQAQVVFELNRRGGRDFERVTGTNVGEYLAIVLDDEVVSAPVIRDRIGARGQIDLGGAPLEEARDLALVLRAGALSAPLEIIEERTVGPSLGQDSIDQGKVAGIVGLVLIVAIMVGYYRVAGALAIGALGVYVMLVLGGLAALDATLTLPGIAGIILSVGMAVDANVLIFERIREELAAGRATRTAVDEGFANALSAIVDSNITTLITALILFQFGTGAVQGFAVTLSIGIVASFISALYVTRTFFLLYLLRRKASDPISI
jgi:preprotein translocase subunit SecD